MLGVSAHYTAFFITLLHSNQTNDSSCIQSEAAANMKCNPLEKTAHLSCSWGRWHWPWSVSLYRCGVITSLGLLQILAAKKKKRHFSRPMKHVYWETKQHIKPWNMGLVSFLRIFGQHRKHSVILIFKDWGKWLSTCGGKLQGELSPSFYLVPWLDRKLLFRRVRGNCRCQ